MEDVKEKPKKRPKKPVKALKIGDSYYLVKQHKEWYKDLYSNKKFPLSEQVVGTRIMDCHFSPKF
jgi:hypothetical protein